MAPSGLAILLGAGPAAGAGIARILAHPDHGNLAVALIARRPEPLEALAEKLREEAPGCVVRAFPADTSREALEGVFEEIGKWKEAEGLKLRVSIFSIKHSHKTPFLQETRDSYTQSLESYAGGAFSFAQLSLARFFHDHGEAGLADGAPKKGTLIFTGTLGALRCNAEFAAYGSGRASARQLAQTLAREMSPRGVHVVHAIANGRIVDEDNEETRTGKVMSAEAVGKTYLFLSRQEPALWTHELDLRPALERF